MMMMVMAMEAMETAEPSDPQTDDATFSLSVPEGLGVLNWL